MENRPSCKSPDSSKPLPDRDPHQNRYGPSVVQDAATKCLSDPPPFLTPTLLHQPAARPSLSVPNTRPSTISIPTWAGLSIVVVRWNLLAGRAPSASPTPVARYQQIPPRPARNRRRRPGTGKGAETRTHLSLRFFSRGVMRYRDTYFTHRYGPRESGEGK